MKSILAGPRKGVAPPDSPADLEKLQNRHPAQDTVEVSRLALACVRARVGGYGVRTTRHGPGEGSITYRETARASHMGDAWLRIG